MSNILDEVANLKASARSHRDFEDYPAAETDMKKAIELLRAEHQRARDRLATVQGCASDMAEEGRLTPSRFELQVAEQLADCYGSLGGILRRAGRLKEAIVQYDNGYAVEVDNVYGLVNTYNTINRLVLRLLVAPRIISAPLELSPEERNAVGGCEFGVELDEAARRLETQLTSIRRNDPWAQADLVMISALRGPDSDARLALKNLDSMSPPVNVYASALSVMEALSSLPIPQKKLLEEISRHLRSKIRGK